MTNLDQQSVPINTIRITESAANKINEFAKRDGKKKFGLRVAVKGGGCSGLQYVLEIVDSADESDNKYKSLSFLINIKKESTILPLLFVRSVRIGLS